MARREDPAPLTVAKASKRGQDKTDKEQQQDTWRYGGHGGSGDPLQFAALAYTKTSNTGTSPSGYHDLGQAVVSHSGPPRTRHRQTRGLHVSTPQGGNGLKAISWDGPPTMFSRRVVSRQVPDHRQARERPVAPRACFE